MRFIVLCLLLSVNVPISAAQCTVELVGLRVVEKGIGKDHNQLRPFNWTPGTTLALRIDNKRGGILGLDAELSKLNYFTDDQGFDLMTKLEKKNLFMRREGFGSFPKVSDDGRALLFELTAPNVPSEKAKTLSANGIAVVQVATKSEAETIHGVKLVAGTEIKSSKITYTISEVGKPKWGDAVLQVKIKTEDDVSLIKSFSFKNADGEIIESHQSGTSRMGWNDKYTVEQSYTFNEKCETVDIHIETWLDKKNVEVPFDVTLGVGLGEH